MIVDNQELNLWDSYIEYLRLVSDKSFYHQECTKKNITISSSLKQGSHLLRSRETRIIDRSTDIYNHIIYPKTGSEMPCFGMDLMGFSKSKVVIVFDFQHPAENYDYNDLIVEKMMGQYLNNTKDSIRFFEPGNHFSRYIFVRKCTVDQVNNYLDDFKIYVDTYRALLDAYQPTGEDYRVYKDFDDYMRKLDPVEGYLAHKFDKEFAKKYVDEFLFPVQQ